MSTSNRSPKRKMAPSPQESSPAQAQLNVPATVGEKKPTTHQAKVRSGSLEKGLEPGIRKGQTQEHLQRLLQETLGREKQLTYLINASIN